VNVTAWSAVSPYGLGEFAAGIGARRSAPVMPDPAGVPGLGACLVPAFDPREALGRKGTKTMTRVTGFAVAAVGRLSGSAPEPDAALVIGTATGSIQSMMSFTRASLVGERPFDVQPEVIPNQVMNCTAARCAIWYGIKGPNVTIAGGWTSGVSGLAYARRLLLAGRAATVLCGAAEEHSAARSWLEYRGQAAGGHPAHPGNDAIVLGEGAAMLRLEPAGSPGALATVLALETRARSGPAAVVRRALDRAGLAPAEVRAVIVTTTPIRDALTGIFEPQALGLLPAVAELIGDTGPVAAVFQVAAALALATEQADELSGQAVVVATADPGGPAGAAVLRLAGTRAA
jgi:3-oxoacyl-[acyl-carrier-protein] synthase II